jgi:hypothetical protein
MEETGHSKKEFEEMMARLTKIKLAMIEDDKRRYRTDFTPDSKRILFGMIGLVRGSLDRIIYRYEAINWVIDEDTKKSLVTSGAVAFAVALEACRHLEVVYEPSKRNKYNMARITDDLHDQLPGMQRLAQTVSDWSFRMIHVHETDEPPRPLQVAARQTKKNRFTI